LNLIPRLVLWLYALMVAIVSTAVLLIYAGFYRISPYDLRDDNVGLLAGLFLIFSIFFLFYRTKKGQVRELQTITHRLDNGDLKISYETLEQLVQRAAVRVRGVQNLQTRVHHSEGGGLKIKVRFSIEADLDIPKTTNELQAEVKTYIENTAGIPVEDVTVYVTELAAPKEVVKKRVE
jgi:uncharacterized alkaline shock family protein YloU